MTVTREQVLRHRVHVQQLDREPGSATDAAILDVGVQDTGPDGALWALANRGVDTTWDDLVVLWTLRGAPHAYRRADVAQVAAAVAPMSSADAAKRIFDASRPLRRAGIAPLEALAVVGAQMRQIAATPVVKGEMSTALTEATDEPYHRWCRPCQATHLSEMVFRIGATTGGLELEPGTSPPVLRRIPRWRGPAGRVRPELRPIRGVLHLCGPSTRKEVTQFLDASAEAVAAHWPDDTAEVEVDGVPRQLLAADGDAGALADPPVSEVTRLLGPFDLFLQGRDREVLVPDAAHRKALWPTIGRPGAVLHGHEIAGLWRPRAKGRQLAMAVDLWRRVPADAIDAQGERLAAFRGVSYAGRT